jgi:capsid protein
MGEIILDRIFQAWCQEAMLLNEFSVLRTATKNSIYQTIPHQWFFDGTEHVDPAKEAKAQATRLTSHTTTLAVEFARQGRDWETELHQRAKEKKLMDVLGLSDQQAQPASQEKPLQEEDINDIIEEAA